MRRGFPGVLTVTTSSIPKKYLIDGWQVFNYVPHDKPVDVPEYNGSGNVTCAKFGCGKSLTLTEQLCGKYCIGCSGEHKLDITKVIKFK